MPYSADLIKAKEETEARTVTRDASNRADSPDFESASYRRQRPPVELVRDMYGGTREMREAGKKYLPRHPMESTSKYNDRLDIALAFNAVKRTLGGLVGMIFRRDPTMQDMPDAIAEDMDDVDLQGRSASVFLRQVAENALLDGHTWLHIEEPKVDQDRIRTAQDAEEAGVRPYWLNITKLQAHNWRFEVRAGRPVLTLFAYRELHTEPAGDFGEAARPRIRVLREGERMENGEREDVRGEVWEFRAKDSDNGDRWVLVDAFSVGVQEIPVVFVPGERTGTFESSPPLEDLAHEQREHYRVRSERQKALTYASIAVPYAFGEDMVDGEGSPAVKWGSDGMMLSNDPDATAGIIESRGYGLDALKQELQEIQARMATLGLSLIARSNQNQATGDQRTATENILSRSEGDAWLATFAISLQDAANEALRIHADYLGIDDPGEIQLNRDFIDQLIDPQLVTILSGMVQTGQLSLETMWQILVEGELLPEDFDPEQELMRMGLEIERELGGAPQGPQEPDEPEEPETLDEAA